ncbi:MAG: hypothetical protein V1800_10060 [Candidatus Latescibacterota bacterium]
MRKLILAIVLLLLAGVIGCSKKSTEDENGTLDGGQLVQARCAVCHPLDRVYSAVKNQQGWETTVDRMIGNGAQLDAAEREAVIAYLSDQ